MRDDPLISNEVRPLAPPPRTPHPLCECDMEWCKSELAIGMGVYASIVDRYKGKHVCLVEPYHVQPGEVVLEQTSFYAVVEDSDRG